MGSETSRNVILSTGVKLQRELLWALLIGISIAPILPLSNFVGHPHWDLIRWIPFQDFLVSRNMLKDIIGNILWFMMFGYLLYSQLNGNSASRWSIPTVTAMACGVSLSIEFFQVFCHNRIPAMTDVLCNVLGAGLGGYSAKRQCATTATERGTLRVIVVDGSKTLQ